MGHKVVILVNPLLMKWKLILTQNQISSVNLKKGYPPLIDFEIYLFWPVMKASSFLSLWLPSHSYLADYMYPEASWYRKESLVKNPLNDLCCVWKVCVCRTCICASLIMCVFVCVCVIKDGVWNLKLKQDAQINHLQQVLLSPSEMNHPVKLWWYMANNNTSHVWVGRFTHLKCEKERKRTEVNNKLDSETAMQDISGSSIFHSTSPPSEKHDIYFWKVIDHTNIFSWHIQRWSFYMQHILDFLLNDRLEEMIACNLVSGFVK